MHEASETGPSFDFGWPREIRLLHQSITVVSCLKHAVGASIPTRIMVPYSQCSYDKKPHIHLQITYVIIQSSLSLQCKYVQLHMYTHIYTYTYTYIYIYVYTHKYRPNTSEL